MGKAGLHLPYSEACYKGLQTKVSESKLHKPCVAWSHITSLCRAGGKGQEAVTGNWFAGEIRRELHSVPQDNTRSFWPGGPFGPPSIAGGRKATCSINPTTSNEWDPFLPGPCLSWYCHYFFILAIMLGMQWCHIMVLNCVCLMSNDVEPYLVCGGLPSMYLWWSICSNLLLVF